MEEKRITPYPIRMDEGLRAKLEAAAKSGARSLHSEIVARLEGSFRSVDVENAADLMLDLERANELAATRNLALRLLGYSLMQLTSLDPRDTPDAAALRQSLRTLAISLNNGDVKAAVVEASDLAAQRDMAIARGMLADVPAKGSAAIRAVLATRREDLQATPNSGWNQAVHDLADENLQALTEKAAPVRARRRPEGILDEAYGTKRPRRRVDETPPKKKAG